MHNKYIITYECHDNALRMWKVVQLEKYFDFSLYSHHFSLLSLTSLLSAPEREVISPSDFKVVGALDYPRTIPAKSGLIWFNGFREDLNVIFYQNMSICIIGKNRLKEKFHRKTRNIC